MMGLKRAFSVRAAAQSSAWLRLGPCFAGRRPEKYTVPTSSTWTQCEMPLACGPTTSVLTHERSSTKLVQQAEIGTCARLSGGSGLHALKSYLERMSAASPLDAPLMRKAQTGSLPDWSQAMSSER